MLAERCLPRSVPALMFAVVAVLAFIPQRGAAHALTPSLLEIEERGNGRADVSWTVPVVRVRGAEFWPVLPDSCHKLSEPVIEDGSDRRVERWAVNCTDGSLVGKQIGVSGLGSSYTDVLLRLRLQDGRRINKVLRASKPFMTVPAAMPASAVFRDYSVMGSEHILGGWDHLLFVFGLLLLVGWGLPLVKTITAFTLGHSLTLALAVLGYLAVPSAAVEAAIAFTILLVAVELSRVQEGHRPWTGKRPWIMAVGFGLLHGMGFASALSEVGLPAEEIPLALLSFNLGIEAGQLLFVVGVCAAGRLLRAPLRRCPAWFDWTPIYAIGSLAAYLCMERVFTFVGLFGLG
mgnify:CR=1 FL=1